MKLQKGQEEVWLNGLNQVPVYAHEVYVLAGNINPIKSNGKIPFQKSK